MESIYWSDKSGRIYEMEASTAANVWAWFRRFSDDESVRLRLADLTPMSDAEVLALAKAECA